MQILYVSCHPHLRSDSNAGYATHMRETAAALRRRGHDVSMWIEGDRRARGAGGGGSRRVSSLRRVVPRFVWTGLRDVALMRHDRSTAAALRAEVERLRPDAIYERASYLSTAGVDAAAETGVPLLLEVNAPYVEERRHLNGSGPMDGAGRRWEHAVLHGAARVVTVSSVLRERLIADTGVDGPRVVVQPNGADLERFHPDVASHRAALGLPDDAFVVCFVGSFIRWHRLEMLVDAVADLRAAGAPAFGLLVGDGDVRGELEQRARERGVADHVRFTGTVPFEEVPGHIQAADACVIPGHAWYCSPIKLFEYGGIGKAVVTLDSDPIREVVDVERDCVLFDGSTEGLSSTLAELHRHPGRRRALASALREVVAERYSWNAAGCRISDWIEEVVGASEPVGRA